MTDAPSPRCSSVTDDMVERAWAAIVGADVAPICFQASIIRADLRTALEAILGDAQAPAIERKAVEVFIQSLHPAQQVYGADGSVQASWYVGGREFFTLNFTEAFDLLRAYSLPSTQNATPSGTGGPGPVAADQHAAANTPATSHSSTPRGTGA